MKGSIFNFSNFFQMASSFNVIRFYYTAVVFGRIVFKAVLHKKRKKK